jgi:DNA polymerase
VGSKNKGALQDVKGLMEIPEELWGPFLEYCANDVEITRLCFDYMFKFFPDKELALIDLTTRMFTDPVLKVDVQRAHDEYAKECGKKVAALFKAGVMSEDLLSNQRFAALLEERGVSPPLKISKTTGKSTYAFAKGDAAFQELTVEHPHIKDLVDARLAIKSTIGETRAHRFVEAGKDNMSLPVLLNYYGAHTGRWSGGNKLNLQNLPRGGELRKSILAPAGHVIVVADSAQIEARTVAWLAGQDDLVKLFASGEDVYKWMASRIYGVPVSAVTKDQRFIGKTCVLGLGFGMGAKKLRASLAQGVMGPKVTLSLDECYRIVDIYRNANKKIVELWGTMNEWIGLMQLTTANQPFPGKDGVLTCRKGMILGPMGVPLIYTDLAPKSIDAKPWDAWFDIEDLGTITYQTAKGRSYIYGGLLTENVVQHIARCVVAEQMLQISERYRVVMMTHDECVIIAPEKEADEALAFTLGVMKSVPSWAKGLPLNAEGGYDVCYSK